MVPTLYSQKGNSATLVPCKHTGGSSYDRYRVVTEVHSAKVKYQEELSNEIESLIFLTNAVRLGVKTRKAAKQYSVAVANGKGLSVLLDEYVVTYADVNNRLAKKRLGV